MGPALSAVLDCWWQRCVNAKDLQDRGKSLHHRPEAILRGRPQPFQPFGFCSCFDHSHGFRKGSHVSTLMGGERVSFRVGRPSRVDGKSLWHIDTCVCVVWEMLLAQWFGLKVWEVSRAV